MRKTFLLSLTVLLAPVVVRAANGATATDPVRYVYRIVDNDSLAAFVFAPPAGSKHVNGILLFHGGGWAAGSAEWVFASAERFAQWGMVAIAVDYRLSNDTITPIDALGDVCASFVWARAHKKELGIDGRFAGYGVSAGGHLLALCATKGCGAGTKAPDALLLWSPALDVANDRWFAQLLKGRGKPSDYSPVEHTGATTPPTCIVHGREDTLTPLAGSQRFHDEMVTAGGACELNIYDGVGHLLTRNLSNQEDDYDPDPLKRADGIEKQRRFLVRLGLIPAN
jgi:acetyl esterase/lipase